MTIMAEDGNISSGFFSFNESFEILKELNSIEAYRRWPVILFISVLMIFGVVGNLHVLYIYTVRYKRSTYRLFVLSLAVIDLVACFVSMPFEIVDELHPYDYSDVVSCKLFRFINTCVAIVCALMLVLIASERYRKICTPYADQMSESSAKHLALAVTCVAVIMTSPALYVYGKKTIKIPGHVITGSECTWGDHMEGSIFGFVYYGYVLLIIIMCMVTLSILYSLVGCHLKTHAHNVRRTLRNKHRYILNSTMKSDKNLEVTTHLKGTESNDLKKPNEETIRGSTETLEMLLDKKSGPELNTHHKKEIFQIKNEKDIDGARDEKTTTTELSEKTVLTKPEETVDQDNMNGVTKSVTGQCSPNESNTFDITTNTEVSPLLNNKCPANIEQNKKSACSHLNGFGQENNSDVLSDDRSQDSKGKEQTKDSLNSGNVQPRRLSQASVASSTIAMIKIKETSNEKEARITKVLFTITLLFIISFLPYIIILIVYGVNTEYEESLSPSVYILYLIGLRMYMINNAANCILYSFFDMKFRLIIKELYSGLFYRIQSYAIRKSE